MTTDPAALAASIAAALAATDTAARALWEAMGAPGEYHFGKAAHGACREVIAFFRGDGFRGDVEWDADGGFSVTVRRSAVATLPELEHHGTPDSCRAALAAYLGAS